MRTVMAAVIIATASGGSGCVSMEKDRLVHLRHGLTRAELIQVMGEPWRVDKNGDLEVLHFQYRNTSGRAGVPPVSRYYVVMGTNGRVESFGPDDAR